MAVRGGRADHRSRRRFAERCLDRIRRPYADHRHLGTQLFFTGLAVAFTNGSAITLGYVEPLDNFGNTPVLGVPMCFTLFVAIAVLIGVVLRFTPFGFKLYLMGSNAKAARYAGIPQRRMLLLTYTVCGVLASIAGIIIAARTSSVKWDYGSSYVPSPF